MKSWLSKLRDPAHRSRLLILEVLAIFIGITASFWVEEWREERQDMDTFHRILGEIYYGVFQDTSDVVATISFNNQALQVAREIVLDGKLPETDQELFNALNLLFRFNVSGADIHAMDRLTNTALNIPINDIQLQLDQHEGYLIDSQVKLARLDNLLRELANQHWMSRGVIYCPSDVGVPVTESAAEALDLAAQLTPLIESIGAPGNCIPNERNFQVAREALGDPGFLTAMRTAMNLHLEIGMQLTSLRIELAGMQISLEEYLPSISLPVETIGIVGHATPVHWEASDAVAMLQTSEHEWVGEIELTDGEIKFVANRDFAINWGAPRPWVAASGAGTDFNSGQASLEDSFPEGTAQFWGVDIPVKAGRYMVFFNSRSGAYRFEELTP